MLRGINKQVVFINDTGSDLFEQAIFIVNPRRHREDVTEGQMAEEARRIVKNCIRSYEFEDYVARRRERKKQHRARILLISGIVMGLLGLILALVVLLI